MKTTRQGPIPISVQASTLWEYLSKFRELGNTIRLDHRDLEALKCSDGDLAVNLQELRCAEHITVAFDPPTGGVDVTLLRSIRCARAIRPHLTNTAEVACAVIPGESKGGGLDW